MSGRDLAAGGRRDLLPDATAMGAVTLRVADLDRMVAFYRDAVGLAVLGSSAASAVLGRPGEPVVLLEAAPGLRHAGAHEAGLFHTAILFSTESELAAAVRSVALAAPNRFTGSADHLVSKAFYFTDPEGNGLELYWDRDRTEWSWAHGRVEMATLRLDPNAYLAAHLEEELPDRSTARVGHVHLSVGDVDVAREFYVDRLGFATTLTDDRSVLFVSAGGYHHHMAMNTWNSRGAGRRGRTLGLGLVRLELPDADGLGALDERLRHHGLRTADDGRVLAFDDPWANRLEVTTAERRAS